MHKNTTDSSTSTREIASLAVKYATGAAALACAGQAQAQVVVTPVNLTITADSEYFKFDNFSPNASSVTLTHGNSGSFDLQVRFASANYGFVSGSTSGGKADVNIMANPFTSAGGFNQRPLISYTPGSTITGASSQDYGQFRSNGIFANGWSLNTNEIVGFQLVFNSNTYTGWMDITLNSLQNFTVNSIAIDTTPGQSLTAGTSPVPEPAHTALGFAAGAAGLLALRAKRRRQSALAAA